MHRASRRLLAPLLALAFFLPAQTRAQANAASHESFPLLAGLEKPVEFWKKIFTEYSITQMVFFDPLDMSRIYEVQDVGEAARTNDYIDNERTRIAAEHGVDPERVKAQRGIRERTEAGIKRSGRYMEYMQRVFRERGLPEELAYLPLVESSFNVNARSSAGAMGMWQFMRVTGREYMRVDRNLDERIDPIESTRAAAAYLGQAYRSLGNWPLAITSYNYGKGGIARAVAEVGSDNLVDLIEKYTHPYWGYAPKNFYAEFLVAVEIGKNYQHYFPGLQLDAPANFREIEVKKGSSVTALARAAGLSVTEFLAWNPAISRNTRTVPAGYQMKLPGRVSAAPLVQLAQSDVDKPDRPNKRVAEAPKRAPKVQLVRHRVKRGETVTQIARRYGASAERILEANGLSRANLLQVGALLLIPRK
ncbi:MAG TPA: transglycosylase SLT domain-containing protein [Candidatus Binatia bacterium]|nr:transglycosylase SLT domain-containing protein [Candidatus Binatia bacterium]